MNLDNLAFSTESQAFVTALIALQQANGIDFETAVGRVRATAESGTLLVANPGWSDLIQMLHWFTTPPAPPAPQD